MYYKCTFIYVITKSQFYMCNSSISYLMEKFALLNVPFGGEKFETGGLYVQN